MRLASSEPVRLDENMVLNVDVSRKATPERGLRIDRTECYVAAADDVDVGSEVGLLEEERAERGRVAMRQMMPRSWGCFRKSVVCVVCGVFVGMAQRCSRRSAERLLVRCFELSCCLGGRIQAHCYVDADVLEVAHQTPHGAPVGCWNGVWRDVFWKSASCWADREEGQLQGSESRGLRLPGSQSR